jgi:hypothetical protein
MPILRIPLKYTKIKSGHKRRQAHTAGAVSYANMFSNVIYIALEAVLYWRKTKKATGDLVLGGGWSPVIG